jgi:hypothetical protein
VAGSDLIAWTCTYLADLRDIAETEAQRAELEACVAAAARGEDWADRLAAVLLSMGQEIEVSRGGGYVMLPGLRGGMGAVLSAVCPNGVCSRDVAADAPEEERRCWVQGALMPEKWTSPS